MVAKTIKKVVKGFPVLIHPDESGGFWVECPSFGGCYSEGDTVEDAMKNIEEVIELCLELQEEENRPEFSHSNSSSSFNPLPI
ncbi:MAG: hypothetical protein A2821_01510 [Candidatus Magasanikbacteria bacterium RIFCSPHIGHO2_01_FULL_41_23]|uniref:HicB-like antitoxin of toxin-antitoxin system domain-containing protein n=1 Tax=Candidatus Magasanikbacteria bacterium RIFCSPLOWO2_01_FULL_40_15 TaxID=1798686 RepID=A0A1F6N4P0_9BACT|nr:MAG: hypothetical protein A2821_01510 [Candidatus Magasanikbacteria bacterium RIFCSPHIGHO2_01_FULL_41_23]OGH66917.1 MAG: hypothetical protein A3C66_01815 [Candidatus Magasanikbacteria bacterium RIFCSPHIGHO2_02_FULL_41_35]OGH76694.1 MAG: hypothetical protein A3F22_01110 [Candidatus Magasanikbacteria bacterium RIFCSPHIGHO2_12_FULL_41_16]OGH78899.1 MAG: hypothetical protein A2983_00970 [Candidatus Magasanikbacteria bacterium RIFCSPLOWO2_01_FULL_40_15]